jgi:endonuclease/exonuclease/phosphatase family metal-dependent hydrolase
LGIQPDVVALQECARPAALALGQYAWHGDNPRQGLLALGLGGFQVAPLKRKRTTAKFYFPVRVSGAAAFNLLVVWVKPYQRPGLYMESLLRGVEAYRDFIQSGDSIVIGDLNTAASFGPVHHKLVDMLRDRFGLVSAYHEFHRVAHGDETHPTYYDRTQHGRPYHLDYCFVPQAWLRRIENVVVGKPEDWSKLSDHVPITLDIALD